MQKNLAKFKKGKHGSGLDDIDIEELNWVSRCCIMMESQVLGFVC